MLNFSLNNLAKTLFENNFFRLPAATSSFLHPTSQKLMARQCGINDCNSINQAVEQSWEAFLYRSDCSVRTKSALFVHCCLCSIYLMKIGFEKIMGYPCSSLATKWKLQCIRPTTNTKRFRKFCVRLTHLGTNFAPISHQILHLEKKFPKVYLIRTPSVSLPTAANPALKLSKWPASRQCTNRATLYERSNHCGTCQAACSF